MDTGSAFYFGVLYLKQKNQGQRSSENSQNKKKKKQKKKARRCWSSNNQLFLFKDFFYSQKDKNYVTYMRNN